MVADPSVLPTVVAPLDVVEGDATTVVRGSAGLATQQAWWGRHRKTRTAVTSGTTGHTVAVEPQANVDPRL